QTRHQLGQLVSLHRHLPEDADGAGAIDPRETLGHAGCDRMTFPSTSRDRRPTSPTGKRDRRVIAPIPGSGRLHGGPRRVENRPESGGDTMPKQSPRPPWVARRTFLRTSLLASGGLVLGARPAPPVAAQGQ